MGVTTHIGIVRDGQIALLDPTPLPEGSQVYVIVPGAIDECTARRKANSGETAENIIQRGEHLGRPSLPAEG